MNHTDGECPENAEKIRKNLHFFIAEMLYDTTLTSIALSVFVTNLFKIQSRILFALIYLLELIGLQPADFEPETV